MGCHRYRAIYAVDRGELTANGYFGSEYLLSSEILTIIFLQTVCAGLSWSQHLHMFDIKDNSSIYFIFSVKSQPNVLIMVERMSHRHLQSCFASGCCIFPLFADSLIFSKDLHALIMSQTNLNCSKSSGLLLWVPCELPRSTFYLGENAFFFYLH